MDTDFVKAIIKILINHNGVNTKLFKPIVNDLPNKKIINGDQKIIVERHQVLDGITI